MRTISCRFLLAVIVSFVAAQAAPAATTDTPEARAVIEQYGSDFKASQMLSLKAIYRKHVTDAGFELPNVVRDVSYGPHDLQRIDIHQPKAAAGGPTPVLIFIHGGQFILGDKTDGVIFDNVLNYFARHGVLGINGNYRLAPDFKWPSGAEDVGAIVAWARENASKYNGDPDRIFIMGHSAGAVHVASYAFMEELQPEGGRDGVRGAILMSGTYAQREGDSSHPYYGDDPSLWPARAPLHYLDGRSIPLFVIDAEYDPLPMQKSALELVRAVCDRDGRCPRHQQVSGHNHHSEMYHINSVDDSIAGDINEFIVRMSEDSREGRRDFVSVGESIPDIVLDVRYYSDDNFMGTRADGYNRPVILVSKPAAAALANVQKTLNRRGLGLKIFDAYRPQKAVDHFVRWAADPADILTKKKYYPDLPKDRLFELGYIAEKSGHTRGSTLDLTIVNLESGEELDMGSHWDFFGEISHHDSPLVDSRATANRHLLRNVMIENGFAPYAGEWWHYTLDNEPFPETYFDFDVE